MWRKAILIASISALLAVVLGAFGAHGLTKVVSEKSVVIWNKGVLYQFIHTFAILIVGIISRFHFHRLLKLSMNFFLLGIFCFSGSIYFLTFSEKMQWVKVFGPITPIGGLLFIAGWFCLFLFALKLKEDEK